MLIEQRLSGKSSRMCSELLSKESLDDCQAIKQPIDIDRSEYGKCFYRSARTNKEYLSKVETLKNRICKLTSHEQHILKKVELIKVQALKEEKIRVQRLKDRDMLLRTKKEERKSLEDSRLFISQEKEARKLNLSFTQSACIEKKKESYKVMQNDKQIISSVTKQIKEHYKNINSYNSLKIKDAESKSKSKRIETQKVKHLELREKVINRFKEQEILHQTLITKISQLEESESNCFIHLNQTIKAKALELQNLKNELQTKSMLPHNFSQPSMGKSSSMSSSVCFSKNILKPRQAAVGNYKINYNRTSSISSIASNAKKGKQISIQYDNDEDSRLLNCLSGSFIKLNSYIEQEG